MVGDDLWNDILGSQKAGLRGVFVRSGKHGDADLARIVSARGGRTPDAIAVSIEESSKPSFDARACPRPIRGTGASAFRPEDRPRFGPGRPARAAVD